MKSFLVITLFSFLFLTGYSQARVLNTAGEVNFSVKTITNNGNYSPKHVLAIWVEDENGFVKSRLVRANNRKQYLYTWKAASGNNETDATTGATLSSHQTRSISWDCTDLDGNTVLDGNYTIRVEFTDKHAQGPLTAVTFIKGVEEQHLTPPNEDHFTEMTLDYLPETAGVNEKYSNEKLTIYPNPGNGIYTINTSLSGELVSKVFNSNGKLCSEETIITGGMNDINKIDLTYLKNGIYFVEISNQSQSMVSKIVKQ